MSDSVVITGTGCIGPGFSSPTQLLSMLHSGRTVCRPIDRFDTNRHRSKLAFQVSAEALTGLLGLKDPCSLVTTFGSHAYKQALLAIDDAGHSLRPQMGVFASAVGDTAGMESFHGAAKQYKLSYSGSDGSAVSFSTAARRILRDIRFEPTVIATGCTSGIDALGFAFSQVEDWAESCAVVAAEAPITPMVVAAFDKIRALSDELTDSKLSSMPFCKQRSGFCLAEGAAAILVEREAVARKRNAKLYGRIIAFSTISNAFHMTSIPSDGAAIAAVIDRAMQLTGCQPSDIGLISVHGSSTPQNDRAEYSALQQTIGSILPLIPIFAGKAHFGHALGAASLIEIVACLGMFRSGYATPFRGDLAHSVEFDELLLPKQATRLHAPLMLKIASGFSGIHSCMVIERCT